MCGILAFIGERSAVDATMIDQIRRRGPDMLGIGLIQPGLRVIRHITPSWPAPVGPFTFPAAVAGVLHARLTTSGAHLQDAQPLLIDGELMFAHNGIVYHHENLARAYGLKLTTENDSEVMARLLVRYQFDVEALMGLIDAVQGATRHSFIAATGSRMWIASFGHPLFARETDTERIVSSWRFPESHRLPADSVLEWRIP